MYTDELYQRMTWKLQEMMQEMTVKEWMNSDLDFNAFIAICTKLADHLLVITRGNSFAVALKADTVFEVRVPSHFITSVRDVETPDLVALGVEVSDLLVRLLWFLDSLMTRKWSASLVQMAMNA